TAPTFGPVSRWISALKAKFNIPVIAGGALLKLYPAEVMTHPGIDYAIIGSGLETLRYFLEEFEHGKKFRRIPGLCFREGEQTVINQPDPAVENLDDMPFPARDLFPNRKYHSPFSERLNFTPFLTSRGCVFRCVYCCLPGPLKLRKTDAVLAELEECYYRFGIRDLDMYDTVFTADKERTLEICSRIRAKRLKISWMARTHINLVDEELLKEMKAAGCRMLMYGIESVDGRILKNLGRQIVTPDQIREKVRMTKKAGISAFGFFMLGCPGETQETILRTTETSRSLGLDFAQFTRLTPIGGTPLYEKYKVTHKHDFWSAVVREGFSSQSLAPLETTLSNEEILRFVRQATIRFYFRPFQIGRIISGVRTFRQLINFVRAGGNILFSFLFRKTR
ncbi:MAG: radical SAM protein, partial [Candidatus Omnitrophica bacterium]|nr:radical SAM protein [Candidatus Omnitrophota bacterium]